MPDEYPSNARVGIRLAGLMTKFNENLVNLRETEGALKEAEVGGSAHVSRWRVREGVPVQEVKLAMGEMLEESARLRQEAEAIIATHRATLKEQYPGLSEKELDERSALGCLPVLKEVQKEVRALERHYSRRIPGKEPKTVAVSAVSARKPASDKGRNWERN